MSGIVGLINLDGAPVERERLQQLTDALAYRGPDRQAVWCDGPTGFGHTLLATTFEARREQQPCSLDGQVWITADARIDGRDELKARLRGKVSGDLSDPTDVELILHAYAAWGEDCVRHLLGDFVFAIWDGRENRLFCARDHFGVKCLFHARVGDTLLIGNDLDALRRHPGLSDELDELFIADFLLFGHSKEPDASVYQAIRRLPPAHTLSVAPGGEPVIRRYWDLALPEEIRYRRDEEYIEHFLDVFRPAVADRLRTDRVVMLMSGGMDSASVAAFAQDLIKRRNLPTRLEAATWVIERLFFDDERHFAGLVADRLGIPIRFIPVDDRRILDTRLDTPVRFAEPHLGFLCPQSRLDEYRVGLDGARVCLTGAGGDQLFIPENSFLWDRLRSGRPLSILTDTAKCLRWRLPMPPLGLKWRLGRSVARTGVERSPPLPPWLAPAFCERLDLAARYRRFQRRASDMVRGREPARRTMLSPAWAWAFAELDTYGKALGFETRLPFYDVRVIRFLLGLPGVPWVAHKAMLRRATRAQLPEPVLRRPKTTLRQSLSSVTILERDDIKAAAMALFHDERLQCVVNERAFAEALHAREPTHSLQSYRQLNRALQFALWIALNQRNR